MPIKNETPLIQLELRWLEKVILGRIWEVQQQRLSPEQKGQLAQEIFSLKAEHPSVSQEILSPPSLQVNPEHPYASFLQRHQTDSGERLFIALGLARALQPALFNDFIRLYSHLDLQKEFGGLLKADAGEDFIPTIQTFLFLWAGCDFKAKQEAILRFHPKHWLFIQGILKASFSSKSLGDNSYQEEGDWIKYQIQIPHPYLRYFLGGEAPRLDEEPNFPASLSETSLSFEDVVLPESTRQELQDLIKYLRNRDRLFAIKGVSDRVRPSYVAIFSGMPGTGKTITAKTIGKSLGLPVYIVNLARVVSKYIGETEKNLEKIFDRFDKQNCILFFDEADALFGKRTEVKEAKDRYANQEVAYLLQKVENFQGLVILATNVYDVQNTFDQAFQRRIRRTIQFPFPNEAERRILWEKALPQAFTYKTGLLPQLAKNYQVNGASINNIISDVLIEAVDRQTTSISLEMLEPCLRVDYQRRRVNFEICPDSIAIRDIRKRYGMAPKRGIGQ